MKKYLILVLIVLLIGALTVGVLAGKTGPAGKSNIAHLYLYEKYPQAPGFVGDWPEVPGGAWGKMKDNQSGETFDFVFNGHDLEPGQEYCLIYFEDPEANPWTTLPNIFCLGMGTANGGGEVNIAGSVVIGMDLPTINDKNYPGGAKIWLVLSDNCNNEDWGIWANGWSPTEYLFEGELITFTQE